MLRVTDELMEVRPWAEARGACPFRRLDGTLGLSPGPPSSLPVSWGEFEATFRLGHQVVVYDDAPGACSSFVGTAEEARAYVAAADPRTSGAAGPTP